MGLGTILGALLVGALGHRLSFSRSWRYLLASAVSLAVMAPAVGWSGLPLASWALLLLAALSGMTAAGVFSILAQTYFQTVTPPTLLGKVGSFVTAVSTCAMPLGQGLYGMALDRLPVWLVPLLGLLACLPLIQIARRRLRDV